jgi:hypothetical protein
VKHILLGIVRFYSGGMAIVLIGTAIDQALTGGMRLEARAVAEPMNPINAATLVAWLVCVAITAFYPKASEQ